jgi:hypothetical protein
MTGSRMHAETFAVLRHIEVHGPRTKDELVKGLQQSGKELVRRLANLMMLGYLALDDTTRPANFALTGKARLKLADRDAVYMPAPTRNPKPIPKKARESDEPAMSKAQISRLQLRATPAPLTVTRRARTVFGGELSAPYHACEYRPSPRPGANDAFALPSRFGDTLRWRDGRITDLDGNALP